MTVALAPDWNIAPLAGLSQVKGRTDATLSEAPIHRFLLDTVQGVRYGGACRRCASDVRDGS